MVLIDWFWKCALVPRRSLLRSFFAPLLFDQLFGFQWYFVVTFLNGLAERLFMETPLRNLLMNETIDRVLDFFW